LVHEAYLRLVGNELGPSHWNGRGHFFGAAAEAMRRILVESARRRGQMARGGGRRRGALEDVDPAGRPPHDGLLALDGALARLERSDALCARLVKLRYFAGLTMPEAAEALGIPLRSAERNWTYARTWLHRELSADAGSSLD